MNWHYLELEEALGRLLESVDPVSAALPTEIVALEEALGRTVAADIPAATHHPPFDRSPLDGYALRHTDIEAASREAPVVLRVVGRVYAGDPPLNRILAPGEAVRIMTGAAIPAGADCVLRQEDTDEGDERVAVYRALRHHENYCFQGEDVRRGDILIRKGETLDFPQLGVLAGQGYARVAVRKKPLVGILSTGNELVSVGTPLPLGKIYNSNGAMLSVRTRMLGGVPVQPGQVEDDPARLAGEVGALLERCPLVITTGGVSVGERDYLPAVARQMGGTLLFHGVAVKPGAPAMAFQAGGGLALCLSGNPYAAAATFELLARPVIRKLSGAVDPYPAYQQGALVDPFPKPSPARRFVRARAESGKVYLPREHESGKLASLMRCNCLIDVPAGSPALQAGVTVRFIPLWEEDSLWKTTR